MTNNLPVSDLLLTEAISNHCQLSHEEVISSAFAQGLSMMLQGLPDSVLSSLSDSNQISDFRREEIQIVLARHSEIEVVSC